MDSRHRARNSRVFQLTTMIESSGQALHWSSSLSIGEEMALWAFLCAGGLVILVSLNDCTKSHSAPKKQPAQDTRAEAAVADVVDKWDDPVAEHAAGERRQQPAEGAVDVRLLEAGPRHSP